MSHEFRIFSGCPVPKNIAPYIKIICDDAGGVACNSIYRGSDAEFLLNRLGKSSQRQLYAGFIEHRPGFLPANPPGFSTHEQKSDGVAYPSVPRGGDLPWWGVGFDVDDTKTDRVIEAARKHGWTVFRPYHSGTEFHHLNFKFEPKPKTLRMKARVIRLRATMQRKV